eukprot:TRINITY_DN1209_c0_g1_i1.p1 TRINITY_DN1209_c0_g1~~TRINITY_DN1209_c0_g1_i1.p1  ORF type:complete len:680 (+),score=210.73 TRINITY_DN1209_c0_g1_i1:84-2042(+)
MSGYLTVGERVQVAIDDYAKRKLPGQKAGVKERMGLSFRDEAGQMPSVAKSPEHSLNFESVAKTILVVYFISWVLVRAAAWAFRVRDMDMWEPLNGTVPFVSEVAPHDPACGAALIVTGGLVAGAIFGRLLTDAQIAVTAALVPLPQAVTGHRVEPERWRGPLAVDPNGFTAALSGAAAAALVWRFMDRSVLWLTEVSPEAVVAVCCSAAFVCSASTQHLWLGKSRSDTPSAPISRGIWIAAFVLTAASSAGLLGEAGAFAVTLLGLLALVYRRQFALKALPSKESFSINTQHFQELRRKLFPPPYPNGWFRLCNSVDIADGNVKSISALGRHFVAFRGEDGKAGVLHAFCPHIGAHLGGGCVKGNGIQCPFHHWTFDRTGKCIRMPSSRFSEPKGSALVERSKAKAYHVREHLGMIFIWFHAENVEPQWEMKYHLDCADTKRMYMGAMRQLTMEQHVCEMSENSADYFHFQTLHRPMPIPGVGKLFTGRHAAHGLYPPDRSDDEKHCVMFEEEMQEVMFLDRWRVPGVSGNTGGARVIFEGPGIVHFELQAIPGFLGRLRMIKTMLPIEPFKLHVETRWFAEWAPPHVVNFLANIAVGGLEQDREVWETKIFRREPRLTDGDGPYRPYRSWWNSFYSEHSEDMDKPEKLEW